jgi:hypothetical protein
MKPYAKMTTTKQVLKQGTKTVFITVSTEESIISEKEYNNIIDSSPFFRRLDGSEHHTKCYTSRGYKTYQLSSKSPDRQQKTIRTFDFDNVM